MNRVVDMVTEKIRTWRDSARVVIPERSEGQREIGLQPKEPGIILLNTLWLSKTL